MYYICDKCSSREMGNLWFSNVIILFLTLGPLYINLIPYNLRQRQPVLQGHAAQHFCQRSMLHSIVFLGTQMCTAGLDPSTDLQPNACSSISLAPGGRLSHQMCQTVLRCPPCHHGVYWFMPENKGHLNINENTHMAFAYFWTKLSLFGKQFTLRYRHQHLTG